MGGIQYDPTIPRQGQRRRGTAPSPSTQAPLGGWLQLNRAGKVVLISDRGHVWPIEWVSIKQGWFGNSSEGASKLPRLRRYRSGDSEEVLDPGDKVMISFEGGNPNKPIIEAGFRALTSDDFLPRSYGNGVSENRLAMRLRPRTESGEVQGELTVEVCADDKGSIEILLKPTTGQATRIYAHQDGTLEFQAAGGAKVRIEKNKVAMGTGDPSHPFILSNDWLGDMLTMLTALNNFMIAAQPAATAGVIAAAAGTFNSTSQLPDLLLKLAAGAYVSNTVKGN